MERMQRLTREAEKLQLSDAELLNNFQAIGLQCAECKYSICVVFISIFVLITKLLVISFGVF
jgi:hypothetical protein